MRGSAPATQHDLWVWTHGTGEDVELDVARAITFALAPVGELAAEQPCFVYKDSRDPQRVRRRHREPPVEDALDVALVPDGEAGEGGAFVITQRWVHDLGVFNSWSQDTQEAAIGRTKLDSVELDEKPDTARISRVVIEEDGEELEIYRRSTPVGRVGELGLYFVAFRARPQSLRQDARADVRSRRRRARPAARLHPARERVLLFAPSLDALDGLLPGN